MLFFRDIRSFSFTHVRRHNVIAIIRFSLQWEETAPGHGFLVLRSKGAQDFIIRTFCLRVVTETAVIVASDSG